MKALEIKNLTKTYKNNVEALRGIDLSVERGDFFALLGLVMQKSLPSPPIDRYHAMLQHCFCMFL